MDGTYESYSLAGMRGNPHHLRTMGAYPGRKQVRNRVKRAAKNDRIIAKRAAEKKAAKK
jgi:hypothetical protein